MKKIHILLLPITFIHSLCPHLPEKHVKVGSGLLIMMGASFMALHPVAFVPHVIWDCVAYGIHGYGALPLIHILCKKYDLELRDEKPHKPRKARKLNQIPRLPHHINN